METAHISYYVLHFEKSWIGGKRNLRWKKICDDGENKIKYNWILFKFHTAKRLFSVK